MSKIISAIKKFAKKLLYGVRYDSDSYLSYLRSLGMRIGEGVRVFAPRNVIIDERTPCMIEIGNQVQITAGVTILSHGFDWTVLKGLTGEVLGSRGKVKIGDNVFIGVNTTILKGVTIGNNVIIGANSLVTHDIPDNCVAVGSPATPIMSIEDYYAKRKSAQYEEAAELVREYRATYGKDPSPNDLSEFFWLFTSSGNDLDKSWEYQMKQAGNEEFSYQILNNNKKMFNSMQDFLDSVE